MAFRKKTAFVCEGCGTTAERDICGLQPDGWIGYGASATGLKTTAVWCQSCASNGTMDRFSVTTYRRAVAIARSRGLLTQLVGR